MTVKLGELLVRRGVLTPQQRDEVLRVQGRSARPFGDLAERLFGVLPSEVEDAWVEQYEAIVGLSDVSRLRVEPRALRVFDRLEAWHYRMLPVRFDSHDLEVCTCSAYLVRALQFTGWRVSQPVSFLLADPAALAEAIKNHYPIDRAVDRDQAERRAV